MRRNEHFLKAFGFWDFRPDFFFMSFALSQLIFFLTLSVFFCPNVFAEKAGAWSRVSDWLFHDSSADPGNEPVLDKHESLTPEKKDEESLTIIASRLSQYRLRYDEVPANVSFKSKKQIAMLHPRTFQDAVRDTEGAIFYDGVGNGVDTTFSLRGFSEGSGVIFLVDGVRVNEVDGDNVLYPLLPVDDLENLQIIRGSASPVYGSDAFAGVVHLETAKPSEKKISLFGGFEWSSFGGVGFHQGFSGTLADRVTSLGGTFQYYFNAGRKTLNGFRPNSEFRITSFNMKAGYELPDNSGRFKIGMKHFDDAVSNPGEISFDQFQADEDQTNKPLDGRDFRNTILQIEAGKKFWEDRIDVSVMTSWRTNLGHFYATTGTFTDCSQPLVGGWFCADQVLDPDTDLVTTKSRATDMIWQAYYEDEWKDIYHHTLMGMEFRDATEYSLEQDALGGNVLESAARETDRSSRPDHWGLFWRQTFKFFEKVMVYAGMRHDFHRLGIEDMITPADSLSRRWNNSSVSTGLTFMPVEPVDLFVNYSQGFRVPTISEIVPFSGTISTGLNAEKTDSYDIGTRLKFGDLAKFKASYFLIDMNDEIVWDSTSVSVSAPFGQNINIGKSRRHGIETRLEITPIKEIYAYGSYTWTKAYVRETATGSSLVDGRSLGLVPSNRITAGMTLKPFQRYGAPYDSLSVSLLGALTGKQHPQSFESSGQGILSTTGGAGHTLKPYTVWDMIVSYTWRQKEIYLKINNLFDAKYYSRSVAGTSFGTAIYPAGDYVWVVPGPRREFVLGTRWEI